MWGGKCLIYFMFVYLIGRFVRIHQDTIFDKSKTVGLLFFTLGLAFCIHMPIYLLLKRNAGAFSMDCSPFMLIGSLCVFYLFKSFTFQNLTINWMASSVLAVYLCDGMRYYLDRYFLVSSYSESSWWVVVVLCETLGVVVLALITDKIRLIIFKKVEQYICNNVAQYLHFIYSFSTGHLVKFIEK